ncbi:DEAD/DEAH box helicase family protein [Glycomyces sp. YM15]|uniref:DEAD/DEAH box helicase n=1 Tax=Glycomyces sp. YM15 TaxID=2800446 RepID=UPI0027DE2491|nr:DEAD/DEAH box helicase family protein [Glycomyces sp. YM15]
MSGEFLSRDALLEAGPRGLPLALKRALMHLGFDDVRVVDGAGDGGADVLAVRDREQWVFQCKWSNRRAIDSEGIDDLERARTQYRADKAVLVTNTGLTRGAEQRRRALESVGIKISVWDGPTLSAIWDRMPDIVPGDFKLRDYQREAVDAILDDLRREGRALLILATGLGKTVIGAEIVADYLRERPGASVLVVAHMKPLVEQLEQAIWKHLSKQVPTCLMTGDTKPSEPRGVVVGTIETVLGVVRTGWRPDLVMVDETHHVGENGKFAELLDLCENAAQFGVTATPWRGDKFDITARFGRASYTMSIADGMSRGFLSTVDYRMFVDNIDWDVVKKASEFGYSIKELNRALFLPQRDEEILEHLRAAWRNESNPRAIVFCQTIDHAERVATLISTADNAWRRAACLHSGLNRQRKEVLLNEFRLGRVPILTCVDVLNEGVDVPDVNLIAFLRVTHSRRIFVQQLGRGLRLSPGKDQLRVLDFVTDIRRIAATLDLKRALEAEETEQLRLRMGGRSRIEFNDATAGSLLDHWIEDAASLETAADEVRLQFPPL